MSIDRPTILQIIPRLDTGGAELSVVEIAEAIVRGGGHALVLAERGRLSSNILAAGGEVLHFPAATKNPGKILANALAITRIIAERNVHLVHARSRAPAWSALMAARRSRVPFVTTYHGAYSETFPFKRAYNRVMARGDVVIANSRYTARVITDRYKIAQDKIEVIHRGVDPVAFNPDAVAPERVATLLDRWGVDPDQRIVLQAARLTAWKGQGVLIDATFKLHARGQLKSAVIVLAGDAQGRDGYVEKLRTQIATLGLDRQVRMVGHVDDMAAAYLAAHVTVIASTEPEAFGRTAIEAAAMGCPVIATEIGAPPETVRAPPVVPREDSTGWLVPPGDADALAEQLTNVLTLSPSAHAAMGARARRHVQARFTRNAMQQQTLRVYDRLLGTTLESTFASDLVRQHSTAAPAQQS